ncbi:ShlB/FhaC/HecB family hemolysin secretion/activation protein [Actinobacillus equuli]|uniref:Hemolysin activation/secretion protein n=3 Tax=Actinobacillus equuli TaxID=718 RepID=A0AAX3FIP7_ACTEU|nr:ShlB/FhaC/HecB family hemolysin secretion/activation protein [Actinobacillus equuli]AIZ79506.1 peptide transporter [Actinobacillus equuli subsp. equuli]WGE43620.1 ShlB/FhaC/HecB family hemolysin secretion/activation protein [Actinobacillus equuli subsp. equuli]VEE90086.1 hemolysin activation/secretion protein [Actinobacillus equuli]
MSLNLKPFIYSSFLTFPVFTLATPTIDPVLNNLDAVEQQRQQQQAQQREAQFTPQADIRMDTRQDSHLQIPTDESPCYPIHRISLIDYSAEELNQASQFQWAFNKAVADLKLTLPHCLGGEGLGILMKQTQNNIIEKGYVTTRVVAQEQDLRSGNLVLTVIAGKVRHTLVADGGIVPRFTPLHALTGLTFEKGDILNVRDIEQSLENLKRVPTADANIEILPSEGEGSQVGESDLKISYAQAIPFRLNLGLEDSGSTSTGKWQASATLSWDNIFSANDLFYTSFTHSIKRHSDDKGKRASRNLSFYYSIPFGYWQLTANHSSNRYHQQVFGAFENYLYAGESENDKLTLSRVLYRDAVRKTTLSGGFWSRSSKNFVDNAEVEVQRRRMAGWEAGIAHKEYLSNATLEMDMHFKRGTGVRGTISAPEEAYNEGTSRPKIITASIDYKKPFELEGQAWQFHTSVNAQWNKTPLIAQDRMSIGGRHSVRGFDGELSLSGERGWYWRNELSWNVGNRGHWFYWGLDGGRVSGLDGNSRLGHHLMGTVIGLRGGWKGFYYDYFVGRPMRHPEGFRTSKHVTGFNLGYSF